MAQKTLPGLYKGRNNSVVLAPRGFLQWVRVDIRHVVFGRRLLVEELAALFDRRLFSHLGATIHCHAKGFAVDGEAGQATGSQLLNHNCGAVTQHLGRGPLADNL